MRFAAVRCADSVLEFRYFVVRHWVAVFPAALRQESAGHELSRMDSR